MQARSPTRSISKRWKCCAGRRARFTGATSPAAPCWCARARRAETFEARGRLAVETGPERHRRSGDLRPARAGAVERPARGLSQRRRRLVGERSRRLAIRRAAKPTSSAARCGSRRRPDSNSLLRLEQGYIDGDGPAGQNHALFARDSFDFSIDNRGYAATDWEQATLEANWHVAFGDGIVTSIRGWRSVEVPWAADIDSTPNFVFHTRVLNAQDQSSEELRYAGTFGAVGVTAGSIISNRICSMSTSAISRRHSGALAAARGISQRWAAFANADWQRHRCAHAEPWPALHARRKGFPHLARAPRCRRSGRRRPPWCRARA